MHGKKNLHKGRTSPSRSKSIAGGLTTKHAAVRHAKVARRLTRLSSKYEALGGSPSKIRRAIEVGKKLKAKQVKTKITPTVPEATL